MLTVYLNGKFTAQGTTGVQRVAWSLLAAVDRQRPAARWVLLCPPGVRLPELAHVTARTVGSGRLPLHFWEQCVLPWAARDGLLVNLSGSAPWFARRQACILHDAAVFDAASSYTRPFVWWYRALFRHLARRGARLLTVSAFSRKRLAHHLDVAPSRIEVVPNAADHLDAVVADDRVLPRLALNGVRFLLVVASDNPAKNLPALLSAFTFVRMEIDCGLVIVGGSNRSVFRQAPLAADATGLVRAGVLDDAALKALYLHAEALVLPSLYEGCGLPALEAMRCGCPVAAADAAAVPEVCGDAALYFDPRSVEGMARALRQLLLDEPLRRQLIRAGAARASAWRWDDAARQLVAAVPAGDAA